MKQRFWQRVALGIGAGVLWMGAAQTQAQAQEGEQWTQSAVHGDWVVLCQEGASPAVCQMVQAQDYQAEEGGGGRLLEIALRPIRTEAGETQMLLSLVLPFGLDIQAGIALQVDANDQLNMPFSVCYNSGCQASGLVPAEFVTQVRTGTGMKVGFRPYGGQQTMVVDVSLSGSGAALAAIR